jgi:hypothetical protein
MGGVFEFGERDGLLLFFAIVRHDALSRMSRS